MLTTGVDNIVGFSGNDTINGTGKTLTSLDNIDGGAGVDTLSIQDPDAVLAVALPSGAVIKNVEKMVVNTSGALGNVVAAATASAKGVNTITFTGTPVGTDTYTVTINGVNFATAAAGGTAPADEATVVAAVINAQLGAGTATVFGNTVQFVGSAVGSVMPTISVAPLVVTGTGAASAPAVTLAPSLGTAATTAAIFDVTGITGLAEFTGSAAGVVNLKAADTTDVTMTNTAAAAVTVAGGKTVNVTNGAGAVTIDGGAGLTSATVTGGTTVAIDDQVAGVSKKVLTSVTINKIGGTATLTGDALTSVTLGGANAAPAAVNITNATAAHTLTINANGAGFDSAATPVAQLVTVTDANAATVAFNTTAKSNLALGSIGAGLTKVTATGAGDLTLSLNSGGNAAVAAFDGSTAIGGLTLTNVAAATVGIKTGAGKDSFTTTQTTKSAFDMGAGDDTVTVASALVAGTTINLGAGNDKLLFTTGGSVANSTATVTTVIDAGDGTDTLALALVGSANIGVFKNFEVFDTVGISAGTTLDLDILASNNTVTGIVGSGAFSGNGTVTLTNLGAGVGYSQNGAFDSTNDTLALTQKVAGALTVTLNADSTSTTAQNDTGLQTTATNATSLKAVFDVDSGFNNPAVNTNDQTLALTGSKATSLEVVSGGTNATNVLNYTGAVSAVTSVDFLTTVTIAGSQGLSFAYTGSGAATTAIATIDAAAMTGGLTVGTIALKDGGTIKLGSGVDSVLVAKASIAATTASIESLQNLSKSTSATDAAAIKLADKLSFDYATTDAADAVAVISTAATGTGFAVSDKGVVTFTGAGPTTLDAALVLANTASGATDGNAVAFQYINDTYVFVEGGGSASTLTGDVVIKLVGVTGVTSLNEVGTTDVLFLV
jgi:S-layer protein